MMEERDDMAVLIDEDGQEHRFLVVEIFPVKDLEYAIPVSYTHLDVYKRQEGRLRTMENKYGQGGGNHGRENGAYRKLSD